MSSPDLPVALFDSGVGGLTVMKEISKCLPSENIIYLGDTAHLPYGEKSPEAIVRYTINGGRFLIEKNIKLLIIACHTASARALKIAQETLPIPILGVIDGGLQQLLAIGSRLNIAILGTNSTIESGIYQSLIQKHCSPANIFPIACPLFVPLVEEEFSDHKAALLIADHYLHSLKSKKIDAALLACTHYPLLRTTLQEVLGPRVRLIEPAPTVALQAHSYLKQNSLLNQQATPPLYQFYATEISPKFSRLAALFFPEAKEKIEPAYLDRFSSTS